MISRLVILLFLLVPYKGFCEPLLNAFAVQHPIIKELQIRALHKDHLNRIWIGTDSGVYRYTSHSLTYIGEEYNDTGRSYNGPTSEFYKLNTRYLLIRSFPNTVTIFDLVTDKYIAQPYPEINFNADSALLARTASIDDDLTLWITQNGNYLYSEEAADYQLISTKQQDSYLFSANKVGDSLYFHYMNHIVEYDLVTRRVIRNIYSAEPIQHLQIGENKHSINYIAGNKHYMVDQGSKEIAPLNLCDAHQVQRIERTGLTAPYQYLRLLTLDNNQILLINECGIRTYNMTTQSYATLAEPADDFNGIWLKNAWTKNKLPALIDTHSGIFLVTKQGKFLQVTPHSNSSNGGSTVAAVQTGDNDYLIANGEPGLISLNNKQPYFKGFSQVELERLTGGHSVRQVVAISDTEFWLASQTNGLFNLIKRNHIWHVEQHLFATEHIRVLNIIDDELWIGTENIGVWTFNKSTGELNNIIKNNQETALAIFRMKVISNNQMLVAANQGLFFVDVDSKSITRQVNKIKHQNKDYIFAEIWGIAQDKKNNIWAGNHSNRWPLVKYNNKGQQLNIYEAGKDVPPYAVYDLTTDQYNNPIVATWGGGLYRLNEKTSQVQRITRQQGLPSDNVLSVIRDDNNHYWVTTDRGIAHIKWCNDASCINKPTVTAYSKSDGLKTNLFDVNSAHINDAGIYVTGGFFGVTWFKPSQDIRTNDNLLTDTYIEKITVNDVKTHSGLSIQGTLSFPATAEKIEIELATGHYIEPHKQYFKYKINQGLWQISQNGNIVLNATKSGKTEIEIIAVNNSGNEQLASQTITLNIAPPLWLSYYAFFVYFILSLAIGFIIAKLREQKTVKLNQQLNQLVKSKTQALESAIKDKDTLFENTSHELKTPLTLILGHLEILSSQFKELINNDSFKSVKLNSEHLFSVVNDLIQGAEVKRDNNAAIANIDIHESFIQLRESFSPLLSKRNTQLIISHYAQDSASMQLFPKQFQYIYANLLKNAILNSPMNSLIVLAIDVDSRHVMTTISNLGTGLRDLNALSKRYQRANTDYSGSGLGLDIVSTTISTLKGQIRLVPSDTHTRLQLTLPIVTTSGNSEKSKVMPQYQEYNQASQNLSNVLIVEDNIELTELFKHILQPHYNLTFAPNGDAALLYLQQCDSLPDIILSDVMMPVMDGFTFCENIKSDSNLQHIPLLLITAKSDHKSEIKGLKCGADDYIHKPFIAEPLRQKIDNILATANAKKEWLTRKITHVEQLPTNEKFDARDAQFVEKIEYHIKANCTHNQYKISDLCSYMHMTESTLRRHLKSATGSTFKKLVNEVRLNKARLLITKGHQIQETAELCGYASVSHLSNAYKVKFGETPSQTKVNS